MKKIAAAIILYHPDLSVLQNINSYLSDVDILFAIDNSEVTNPSFVEKIIRNPKIHYLSNHGNKGIAYALNVGAKKAMEMGYHWLLTMDQDSHATTTMIQEMFKCSTEKDLSKISIIAPFHANPYHRFPSTDLQCSRVLTTMTSGNLLNLEAYAVIGPFRDDLFIDYVDNEYCLRSTSLGFTVIQANKAILNHNLGNLKQHTFFWKKFYSTNHSPIRRYYAFRNRSKIIELYTELFPLYCRFEKSRFFVDSIIILLYEKQKFSKFKMMLRGLVDYKRNIFGKYHD
ncbi:MAG: glycosyltransferase family 2 protein [Sulfuricurvum sp.]|nr:glycosyltransferase family 2 protein [Sulfuricurvum sp.]